MSDTEDYEALRQKNIAARNAFFQEQFNEIEDIKTDLVKLESTRKSLANQEKENQTPVKRRRISRKSSPSFRGSAKFEVARKYNTRSRQRKIDDPFADLTDSDDENSKTSTNSIKVMFPFARPIQRDIDLIRMDCDDEEWGNNNYEFDKHGRIREKKRRIGQNRNQYDPSTIPSPDEITQRMLDNIAERATGKVYDQANGTSCHQCRQKTKDTKTVCRSGECVGVRGQFCGPCLKGRYGENALEALKDPNWACPPCRGLCNCSICRTREGKRPTGILAPLVKEEGYKSVKDYLLAEEEGIHLDSE